MPYRLSVFHWLAGLPSSLLLVAVFALPALECSLFFGLIFPGETALIIGGLAASAGHVSLGWVIGLGIAGAIIGDSVGYAIGRRWGRRLIAGRVPQQRLERVEAFLRNHGGKAVFLGRFVAALRVLVPSLAGMMHLPRRTFFAWNVLGGTCWAVFAVLIGYYGGESWKQLAHASTVVGVTVAVLVVLAVAAVWWVRRRRARASEAGRAPR